MGVTGLWTVLHPCARPIKIETLNRKRLAVDASIWIYQFLKAVRDKEGNALRNSHVVGFFRRICKLLYLGIKPVFVFDGGAPVLKRQTVTNRRRRREGRRDDAVRTAGRMLAVQMQRQAEEEEQKRKDARRRTPEAEQEEAIPDNLVYAEEINLTPQERQKHRKFKKQDAYHLPNLDANLHDMGQPNDPRIMSLEELQHYANQFQSGEDINVYDFSKIDFDSPFFTSLPASDRYNILNAARLRSRLRMGHSKEQLDAMFPNRMEFSKFQIERVRERNELTQRLMHINNAEGDLMFGISGVSRVAGEKGREYVLVRNDGVEGGWALGVVSNDGKKDQPIDVDAKDEGSDEEVDSEEDDFEDVPIEGVNRLPRLPSGKASDAIRRSNARRQAFYGARRRKATKKHKAPTAESLFVQSASSSEEEAEEWEEVPDDLNEDTAMADEEDELQRAIAMSMQQNEVDEFEGEEASNVPPSFEQRKAPDSNPFARKTGKAIAHEANLKAQKAAPNPFADDSGRSDDDAMDLQAALAESRRTKHRSPSPVRPEVPQREASPSATAKAAGFDGPLPFEKLSLGSSLLGKKKMEKIEADQAGGFERDLGNDKEEEKKKKEARPLPPWFAGNLEEDLEKQRKLDEERKARELEEARQEAEWNQFLFEPREKIRRYETQEVIDLEASQPTKEDEVVVIDSEPEDQFMEIVEASTAEVGETRSQTPRMGDLAEDIRVNPPVPDPALTMDVPTSSHANGQPGDPMQDASLVRSRDASPEQDFEWEDSDNDNVKTSDQRDRLPEESLKAEQSAESDEDDFEDVVLQVSAAQVPEPPQVPQISMSMGVEDETLSPPPMSGAAHQKGDLEMGEALAEDDDHIYSDPDDEELMLQLAQEEEEHARFASSLATNQKTLQQNIRDYEAELKQLRNQQKKDRRDADEVTQTMITECQQLLALFGLPYITAPMEAEAQCAELVTLGLVDGIVTDDSDVFLFGGTRVYKNVFNQAKFVECYLSTDLESEFGLTRQRLISIAQLLGSDYTEGLPGIGPVTALEIISEFDGLKEFKEWFTQVQMGTRSKEEDAGNAFRKKFRRQTTKLVLPMNFPDSRVEAAYLHPEVDNDPSEFVWGVPDLAALRQFLMSTIGWSEERVDEILVPVIRDMNKREQEGTQANITKFFGGGVGAGAFAPRVRDKAGRLEKALDRIGMRGKRVSNGDVSRGVDQSGEIESEDMVTVSMQQELSKKKKKTPAGDADIDIAAHGNARSVGSRKKATKRTKQAQRAAAVSGNEDTTDVDNDDDDDDASVEPKRKVARKGTQSRQR